MQKGKAFVVVGHENWGKSRTLKALTNRRQIKIGGVDVWIKRMSNDDVPPEEIKKILSFIESKGPVIIIALCPNFREPGRKTVDILEKLQGKYFEEKIFTWA